MQNITFEEIKNMSDEQVAELNRKLGKKMLKQFAIRAGITVATVAAVNYLVAKFDDSETED